MSEQIKDGGPAFPTTEAHGCNNGTPGLTLRDYFAAKAMQAVLTAAYSNDGYTASALGQATDDAYFIADEMLRARKVQS